MKVWIEEYETINGPSFVGCCSCGWRSGAHGHKSSAIGSASHHAGEHDEAASDD